ncbi:mannose-6-phosphate isomerase, class I [Foetidibacter luteolus]|uniref:mannose-6-phosphate isomerase, class I n=1 Tax=Foetidibacter luteolus TaxID=2608880 RepID=UPI00129A7DB4|nr:mannose-6-phosphate isomerase, class I [Foetidibacter luteolus]
MSFLQDKIFPLKGKVQHYAWGGFQFIPAWLGIDNSEEKKPYAEYWMGAHASASSNIVTPNGDLSLNQLVTDYPQEFIGEKVQQQFGELPYLFKILDVKDMLSIQVHPTKAEAEKGFAAEEAAGVAIGAANRNYKDKNHKPEVMVALSEFWLLHGFKQKDELLLVLKTIPEFAGLDELFLEKGYKGLYQYVMELPQQQVNELLAPLVARELERKEADGLSKDQPGWWVGKLFEGGAKPVDLDRGIFSIYFFNIVKAEPGEAVFQGAGIPHAYLEGQNVELMANSDNVLRGGLTPKHVDVPELLKHTWFEGIKPNIMAGEEQTNGERVYNCPVPDFGISKIELGAAQTYHATASSLEIIVVIKGDMEIKGGNTVQVQKGQAVAVLKDEAYTISANAGVLAYKAFVP